MHAMMSEQLDSSWRRDIEMKLAEASSYDRVAERFARLADRYNVDLARRLVDLAEVEPRHRVLDIGSGSGAVAAEALRRLGSGGAVIAGDLSQEMLRVARTRLPAGARVDFARVDAESLAFTDGCVDRVLSLYTLPHLPSPEAALRESYRVLRGGGRLAVGVGTSAPWHLAIGWRHRWTALPDLLRQLAGRQLSGPRLLGTLAAEHLRAPPARGERGRPASLTPVGLDRAVGRVGFALRVRDWRGYRSRVGSAAEFWEVLTVFCTELRQWLAASPPEEVQRLRVAFERRCEAVLRRGGELVWPHGAYFVVGEKPSSGR